jgi:hypothetical protein
VAGKRSSERRRLSKVESAFSSYTPDYLVCSSLQFGVLSLAEGARDALEARCASDGRHIPLPRCYPRKGLTRRQSQRRDLSCRVIDVGQKMNIPPNWVAWFFVVWALLFGYMLFIRLRRLKGKPGGLVEPRAEDVLFDESYASARSHKSTFTRLGGGSRCMRISLTKAALLVRPHFPFSIVGVDADLIHEIPYSAVTDVSEFSEGGVSGIAVRFGDNRRLDIMLKRETEFWSALSRSLENSKTA